MAKFGRYISSTATACLFVFLLLFLATRGGAVVEEKRSCESQSHKFKGRCMSHSNCGSVCNTEGFHGGKCRGFRGRCFCTRPC